MIKVQGASAGRISLFLLNQSNEVSLIGFQEHMEFPNLWEFTSPCLLLWMLCSISHQYHMLLSGFCAKFFEILTRSWYAEKELKPFLVSSYLRIVKGKVLTLLFLLCTPGIIDRMARSDSSMLPS